MSLDQLRERRGLILHSLHAQYPMRLMRTALDRNVMPFYAGEAGQFDRDVEYLRDKGYLDVEEQTLAGRSISAFKITPAGVDLVEGSTKDPGIIILVG
jgi:hypothetical protein